MKKKKLFELNVFGEKWPVYHAKINDNYAGRAWLEEKFIEIHSEIPMESELFWVTLVHEFLHAHFERASYKQSGIPHSLEEVMIDQMATVLVENFQLSVKKKRSKRKR